MAVHPKLIFTVPTLWPPSACEWGRWRADWSPPRSRSTGSSGWSSSGWRSPEYHDTALWPCHLSLGGRQGRGGVACQGVQHCLSDPLSSSRFSFPSSPLLVSRESPAKVEKSKLPNLQIDQFARMDLWFLSSQHSLHLVRNWTGPCCCCNLLSAISTCSYPYLPLSALRLQYLYYCTSRAPLLVATHFLLSTFVLTERHGEVFTKTRKSLLTLLWKVLTLHFYNMLSHNQM